MTLIVPIKDWPLRASDNIDMLEFCESHLPKWAIGFWIDLTLHEIPEAGYALAQAIKPDLLARLCWNIGALSEPPITQKAFRSLMQATWMYAHNHLLSYVRHMKADSEGLPDGDPFEWLDFERQVLMKVAGVIGAADCQKLPEDLQETDKKADKILIYRGTYGLDSEAAAQGLSWTISKSKAEWFALRGPFGLDVYPRREFRYEHGPLVTTAAIDVNDILMWSNKRAEQEVVAYVDPDQWVRCDRAEERVAIFDNWEDWEASRRDSLLVDKAIQTDA